MGGRVRGGVGLGGQGGWERRIEAIVKIQKKNGGGGSGRGGRGASGWGVRVDVNGEVKFCENSKKKFGGGGQGRGGSDQGLGWGRLG